MLHYYGVGGIGKTSLHSQLIRELKHRCPEAKFVDLDFDFVERREPYRVMGLLKKEAVPELGVSVPPCLTLPVTHSFAASGKTPTKREIESFVGGSQVLNFLCDAASMVPGASMVSGIPQAGGRRGGGGSKPLLREKSAAEGPGVHGTSGSCGISSPLYFAADLRNNLKKEKHPFVIFLDTYEKLVNEFAGVGDPLQNDLLLRGLRGGSFPGCRVSSGVLGGREKLKWSQLDSPGAWDNVLHQYLLGTLGGGRLPGVLAVRRRRGQQCPEQDLLPQRRPAGKFRSVCGAVFPAGHSLGHGGCLPPLTSGWCGT